MNKLPFSDIELYSSVYEFIDSNMYLLISNNEAVIIDPHKNEQIMELLVQSNVHDILIILTHEHSDHISGIWWFIKNFDCKIICSETCAKKISCKKSTRPLLLSFKIEEEDRKNGTNILEQFQKDYVWTTYNADITYEKSMHYSWQNHEFDFCAIRGHSEGSSLIVMDNKYAFTGDSLLKEYPVIVSFPKGNKTAYIDETLSFFEKTLKPNMIILPGHGKPFILSDIMVDGKISVEIR